MRSHFLITLVLIHGAWAFVSLPLVRTAVATVSWSSSTPIAVDPVLRSEDPEQYLYSVNLKLGELAETAARRRSGKYRIGEEALDLFATCDAPESVTYNSLLKVLAKVSPDTIRKQPAAELSDEKLEEMKVLYEQQYELNNAWYEKEPKTEQEMEMGPPLIKVKPNVRSYATVMDAYARVGTVQAAERVESLREELEMRFEDYGDMALEPNQFLYNTVLSAWANARQPAQCVERLREFPLVPNRISYNIVLDSLSKAKKAEAAEKLLYSMKAEPGPRSYGSVMDAWARCGRPDKSHKFLQEMLEKNLEPTTISFSIVIHAYAKSKHADKAQMAYKVFEQMKEYNVRANKYTYNSLLNALSTDPKHPNENMVLLKKVYCEMPNKDSITFGTVLKGCSTLLSDVEFPVSVFQDAISQGQVSHGVLWQFRQAVPLHLYQEYVRDWRNIPSSWDCNVSTDSRRY